MPVIDFYPLSHPAVDFALATTIISNQVSEIRVTLRTVTALTTPLTFITDNGLEQEVISKAGLAEDLPVQFDEGTLVDDTTSGPYFLYNLTFPVTTGGC